MTVGLRSRGAAFVAAATIAVGLCSTARAGSVLFDLEDQAPTGQDALTTLPLSQGGVSMTLDRLGQPFGIFDVSNQSGTAPLGTSTLVPGTTGDNPFNVNFATPVTSFSVQIGDFSTKDDTLGLTAWSGPNGTGTMLGQTLVSLPALPGLNGTFTSQTLTINTVGAQSVQFDGGIAGASGGADDNSTFYDNLSVTTGGGGTAVPLPAAAWAAPFVGLLALGAGRRLTRAS